MIATQTQFDLLAPPAKDPSTSSGLAGGTRFALLFEQREWLKFLADEWWPLDAATPSVRVGVNAVTNDVLAEGRVKVVAWLDPTNLPAIEVATRVAGQWTCACSRALPLNADELVWPGPIPLFAVSEFTVESVDDQKRLSAAAKAFSNIELPSQPILVRPFAPVVSGEDSIPRLPISLTPPPRWNKGRGAATMAVWAVPVIDPWLDYLCDTLSIKLPTVEHVLNAPPPPWQQVILASAVNPLWRAAVDVLGERDVRSDFSPLTCLHEVVERAVTLGADRGAVAALKAHTISLLDDATEIDVYLAKTDLVGFALQLVLLRPALDRFATWSVDLPALPPAAWWTSSILIGYLIGYTDLDTQFRGAPACRRLVALRTWTMMSESSNYNVVLWPDQPSEVLGWKLNGDRVELMNGTEIWTEKRSGRRGGWYRADIEADELIRDSALGIARELMPELLSKSLELSDQDILVSGTGRVSLPEGKRCISVDGTVRLSLKGDANIVEELDIRRFRQWLATGAISTRLPRLPMRQGTAKTAAHGSTYFSEKVSGLSVYFDFISHDDEAALLAIVDSSPWSNELPRRVQHYGWRYDYKSRRVQAEHHLGPLPAWAQRLAEQLVQAGALKAIPNQVIVNEYLGDQGIGKHVDCLTCFQGPIVTLSLCETWEMIFRSPSGARVDIPLQRYSAVVMDGPARLEWTHEIPRRRKEPNSQIRGRRVSLTFRTVTPPSKPTVKKKAILKRPSRK